MLLVFLHQEHIFFGLRLGLLKQFAILGYSYFCSQLLQIRSIVKKLSFLIILYFFETMTQIRLVEKLPYMISNEEYYLEAPVQTKEILLRFYYVKRLQHSLDFFEQYSQKYFLTDDLLYTDHERFIIVDDIKFEHIVLIKAIKELCETKKIDSLLHIWNDLKNYRYIHDELLIKEFSILVAYILHKGALDSFYSDHQGIEHIKKLYVFKSLHAMPLEEVLDILDMLVEEITKFFEIYQLGSDLSWKIWTKKYWPIIPFACAALAIRVYLLYAKVTQNQGIEKK